MYLSQILLVLDSDKNHCFFHHLLIMHGNIILKQHYLKDIVHINKKQLYFSYIVCDKFKYNM